MGLDIPKTDRVVGGSSGGTRFYIFLLLGASLCQGPCGWGVEITRSCVIARLGTFIYKADFKSRASASFATRANRSN